MKLTREEQETVIHSSAADQEWDVMTADRRMIRYLKRQGWELKTDHQLSDYLNCKIPYRKVRIGKKQVLTDEQRAKLAIQLKMAPRNRASAGEKAEKTG